MVTTTSNYQFLEMLHRELKPRGYLEIGVRHGDSLRLAQGPAIGVDPSPSVYSLNPGHLLAPMTSDQFFRGPMGTYQHVLDQVDLIYIDGMHLYEFALRDFLNAAEYANGSTVVVFDDTHPYSQSIASRIQPPGDWTGDVWKVMSLVEESPMEWAKWAQVDVSPTGAFVVWDISPEGLKWFAERMQTGDIEKVFQQDMMVPTDVIDRSNTISPEEVLSRILEGRR